MKIDMTDEKLKQIFSKMRIEDEAGSPAFEQVVPRSLTAVRPFASAWRLVAAIALIILLGAGTAMFLVSQPSSSPESAYENWSAMSNWKATTDNMLTLAGSRIDGTLTTATDALLEGTTKSGSASD